jgi:predicted SprT family Zn-dependent metalloprotease
MSLLKQVQLKNKLNRHNRIIFNNEIQPTGISYNKRLRSAAGRAYWTKSIQWIELNPNILSNYPVVETDNTLVHEMIHIYIAINLDIKESPHGPKFRSLMNKINAMNLGVTISIHHNYDTPSRNYKLYFAYCRNCEKIFERTFMRKLRAACAHCCDTYNNGEFLAKFLIIYYPYNSKFSKEEILRQTPIYPRSAAFIKQNQEL